MKYKKGRSYYKALYEYGSEINNLLRCAASFNFWAMESRFHRNQYCAQAQFWGNSSLKYHHMRQRLSVHILHLFWIFGLILSILTHDASDSIEQHSKHFKYILMFSCCVIPTKMWLKNSTVNILIGVVIQHTEKDKAPHPPLLKFRHQWVNYFLIMNWKQKCL